MAPQLRPPRLEDAGLEDCALSPESIMEAFSLAAASANSGPTRLDPNFLEHEETGTPPGVAGGITPGPGKGEKDHGERECKEEKIKKDFVEEVKDEAEKTESP